MKKVITLLLSLLLTIAASGCTPQRSEPSSSPDNSSAVSDKNPFQVEDEMSGDVLGSIGHSPTNMNRDENGKKLPFVYEGGEISIPYEVSATGKAKNVGFLVFVDGIAQPYKTDTASVYQTMHIMNLEEDNKEHLFSIIFEPVTGKKGDTLSLMIVSVYAPDFIRLCTKRKYLANRRKQSYSRCSGSSGLERHTGEDHRRIPRRRQQHIDSCRSNVTL